MRPLQSPIPTLASNNQFVYNDLQIEKEGTTEELLPGYDPIDYPASLANYWTRRMRSPPGVVDGYEIARAHPMKLRSFETAIAWI